MTKLDQCSPAKAVKESGFWRAPSVSFQKKTLIFTLGVPGALAWIYSSLQEVIWRHPPSVLARAWIGDRRRREAEASSGLGREAPQIRVFGKSQHCWGLPGWSGNRPSVPTQLHLAQGGEKGWRGPEGLWESMEVTGEFKSFLAVVLLPEREPDGYESCKHHGSRKMSRWYMSFLNKFVKQFWPVERQTVSKQVFFWWSIIHWEISHGHPCIHRAQVKNNSPSKAHRW